LAPGPNDYKHCLYGHLKFCTAPCIGNVSIEQYLAQVTAACDFLDGQCQELADKIEAEMKKAAVAQEYERAAELRDLLADLKHTTQKTHRFARTPYSLPVAVHPDQDLAELAQMLALPAPPQWIEGFDISNISGTLAVASMVCFKHGRPERGNYRRYQIKTVPGQDDFACLAEVVRRRYTRLLAETKTPAKALDQPVAHAVPPTETGQMARASAVGLPDLILIDGGRGQLSAARAELEKLSLAHIPMIGLAKAFEEIYQPGQSEPLRLPPQSGALKLLQRVRDESHRVANTYNAQLRLRKISESLLDEFPGIGEQRKAALLKKFGSLQRLRRATVEELAAVPGFGGKAAAELKAFLEARTDKSNDQ
jgi:excinuclease ABC subunit C